MQAPPTSLIFFSASLEKKRAFTTIGCLGSCPLPVTRATTQSTLSCSTQVSLRYTVIPRVVSGTEGSTLRLTYAAGASVSFGYQRDRLKRYHVG